MVIHTAEVTDTALSVNSVINLLQQHVNDKKVQLSNPTSTTALSVQSSSKTGPLGRFKQPICANGKQNPSTQHLPEQCWQLNPELCTARPSQSANLTTVSTPSSTPLPSPPAMTTFLLAAFSKNSSKVENILDSGCSIPMFRDQNDFKTYSQHVEGVSLADGTEIQSQGQGLVQILAAETTLLLSSCLHIPALAHNLISLLYLVKKGCQLVYLGDDKFEVRKDSKKMLGGVIKNGIFLLNTSTGKPTLSVSTVSMSSELSMLQHRRLDHLNYGYIHKIHLSFHQILLRHVLSVCSANTIEFLSQEKIRDLLPCLRSCVVI